MMSRSHLKSEDRPADHATEIIVRDVPAIVGTNLKRLRKAQGHSLERLSELSKVSRAMLGQIETGKSVPTISVLWKIADALGVPVSGLVAVDGASPLIVLNREQTPLLSSSDGRFTRRPLFVAGPARGPEFYELNIAPGHAEKLEPLADGSKQNLVVTTGVLVVTVGEEPPVTLSGGDVIVIDGGYARTFENPTGAVAIAFTVVSS
ncbi:MAG: helix-turn-helix transcriptional regulator [Hyphomicrobium sp.]|jgi:transcriptional regulator with XRE-family HTH domain